MSLIFNPLLKKGLDLVGDDAAPPNWGDIGGTLSDQTDLQSALDGKLSLSGGDIDGNLTISGVLAIGDADADPNKILNLDKTVADAGAFGFNSILRIDSEEDDGDFYFGGYLSAQTKPGNTQNYTGGIRALKAFGEHNGVGTVGSIYGAEFQVNNTSSGTISQAVAFKILAPSNSGTISEYMGIELETPGVGRSIVARGGEIVFNDYMNAEADFIVRGDTVYELFKIDTSIDRIQVGGGGSLVVPILQIDGGNGQPKTTLFQTNGVTRWDFGSNITTESGANSGSDFTLNRYDDSGSYIDNSFIAIRSTGQILFGNFNSGFDNNGKLGIGTGFNVPATSLHIIDSLPEARLGLNTTNYGRFYKVSGATRFSDVTSSGGSLIDFDPIPSDGTSNSSFRFFRNVNTVGTAAFAVYLADGSSLIQHYLNAKSNSYVVAQAGNFGVGVTSPNSKLDVGGVAQVDGLRIDITPTSETISPTHTFTISLNGVNYKVPVVAA